MLSSSVVLCSLLGLGYYISEQDMKISHEYNILQNDKNWKQDTDGYVYHNRNSEKMFNDELNRSDERYKEFLNYYYNRDTPMTQLKKDIKHPNRSVAHHDIEHPSASAHQQNLTEKINHYPLQKTVDKMNTSINTRRNNIPNPDFQKETFNNQNYYKTIYPKKNACVYPPNTHNNTEPFFGSGIKQNTRIDANNTMLEHFTGRAPVYNSKKEVQRFFPTVKDPYAVGGLPNASNIDQSRYIFSKEHQNTLPFHQIKVAPGLNKDKNQIATNIGFHDPYRPLGKGIFRDINQLLVNPKHTYKARNVGEGYFVDKGEAASAPTISRKPWKDLSFSNFNSENHIYREMMPINTPEIVKPEVKDKKSIVLKSVQRTSDPFNIGPKIAVTKPQTYTFDCAKKTIKQQTEDAKHSHINTYNQSGKQSYYLDCAKETIKQQTEEAKHQHINRHKDIVGQQTYYFDCAKETIKQQTEETKHPHINPHKDVVGQQTYYFDCAKETIKQQTQKAEHSHINKHGIENHVLHDISSFLNASINALRELMIVKDRAPTTSNCEIIPDKEKIGNYDTFRKQQFDTYEFTKQIDKATPHLNTAKTQIGLETKAKNSFPKDVTQQLDRVDAVYVKEFEKNPYTQSLQSYNYS